MNYSQTVKNNLILPKKNKYTKKDVDNLIIDSLFKSGQTLSVKKSVWIVLCSAAYHDSDFSKTIIKMRNKTTKNEVQS